MFYLSEQDEDCKWNFEEREERTHLREIVKCIMVTVTLIKGKLIKDKMIHDVGVNFPETI